MNRPRILLHIGRNKAGSTTIQAACRASRDRLAAAGIGYGLFGHLWDSDPALPGWQTFDALAAHAAAHPDRAWLVSNEFMFGWPDAFTEAAYRALAGCDVRVIAYVRRYDQWLRSAYAEAVRTGETALDFDAYHDAMRDAVSAWLALDGWARRFGWERVRVRSIAREDLDGGDLLADFAAAIGAPGALVAVADANRALPWPAQEIARALRKLGTADPAEARALVDLAAGEAAEERPYLTAAQRTELLALYAVDAARLRAHGARIAEPPPARSPDRSGPPPSLADVDPALLLRLRDRAADHPGRAELAARLLRLDV